jgi:hypothetical protein
MGGFSKFDESAVGAACHFITLCSWQRNRIDVVASQMNKRLLLIERNKYHMASM